MRVEIGVSEHEKKTIASSIKLAFYDFEYLFAFNQSGKCSLSINGSEFHTGNDLSFLPSDKFIPYIGIFKKFETSGKKQLQRFDFNYLNQYFSDKANEFLSNYFHSATAKETIVDGIKRIGVCKRKNIKSELLKVFKNSASFTKNLGTKWNEIEEIAYSFLTHKNIIKIIQGTNEELESIFKSVRYIAPLRATAERYYRYQDLQIDEIDHTGSNLAMLLRSFSSMENQAFSEWTNNNFGFKVRVDEDGLHYALKIQTDNDPKEYNINDMGFGFSQILPIVASIWMETNSRRSRTKRSKPNRFIFTIEQPELHLHPEYQSKLAKMFASTIKTAKENDVELVILFETHSKTMIDTLGDCIEHKTLDKKDVNIVIFEKELGETNTIISFSEFDEKGYLVQWPVGFFSGR